MMVTRVIRVLDDFSSSAFTAFEVDVSQRGEQTLRCAQLSARLSVELCSPGLWRYYTTLRCTESEHSQCYLTALFVSLIVNLSLKWAAFNG